MRVGTGRDFPAVDAVMAQLACETERYSRALFYSCFD